MFLRGDKINLRPISSNDINDRYLSWLNDQEVCAQNSHAFFPYDMNKLRKYFENHSSNNSELKLAIIEISSNSHIGNVSLQSINWIYRSAEFAILLGDKDAWGKGYGYQAAQLILNHGFEQLNLHRIFCGTTAENLGMINMAKKLGMHQEGVRRDAFFKRGKYQDIIEFGILKDEFILK